MMYSDHSTQMIKHAVLIPSLRIACASCLLLYSVHIYAETTYTEGKTIPPLSLDFQISTDDHWNEDRFDPFLSWSTDINHYSNSLEDIRSFAIQANNIIQNKDVVSEAKTPQSGMPQSETYKTGTLQSEDPNPWSYQEFSPFFTLSHNWRGQASGFLLNAAQLNDSEYLTTRRFRNYGTPEMINVIDHAAKKVFQTFPDTHPLVIGDLSKRYGGFFPPHLSHQSGRDADIGYYVKGSAPIGLMKTTARSLDTARTWAFIDLLLQSGLVEKMFIDYRLQKQLYKYARRTRKYKAIELDRIFAYPQWKGGIINHLKGHADHIHVRFKAPRSTAAGAHFVKTYRRNYRMRPTPVYSKVRKRESFMRFAKRHRVSWRKLLRWNKLTRRTLRSIRPGKKLIVGYQTPWTVHRLLKSLQDEQSTPMAQLPDSTIPSGTTIPPDSRFRR